MDEWLTVDEAEVQIGRKGLAELLTFTWSETKTDGEKGVMVRLIDVERYARERYDSIHGGHPLEFKEPTEVIDQRHLGPQGPPVAM